MYSHYEINVSKNGTHLFATAERSITDEKTAKEMLKLFKEKFPKPQYEVSICNYNIVGTVPGFAITKKED